jgi:dipeptidyl aminopeptidase/acylaminoacyl peptidase
MELGKHPDLWLCGVAGIPVGDYEIVRRHVAGAAGLRSRVAGRTTRGAALMLDRNPINFADDVRVPVLFIIGENDSRCPYRQAMAYVDRLAARGHPHEVYPSGQAWVVRHGRDVRQIRTILEFLAKHVPGVEVPTT